MTDKKTVLEVKNLSVSFKMYDKGLEQKDLEVITNLNISVKEGEVLAIAGSSGSGKSLLAHAVLGILPNNAKVAGEMLYCGKPLTSNLQKKLRGKELALVPQSVEYLDPLMRVGKQVAGVDGSIDKQREVFKKYNLSEAVERLFPFQLSGGMARRVLVSTAVIGNAKLIIADEPTPGLSKEMAKMAMSHFRELADEGCAVLLITHDIDLALSYADRIAVFYAGTTVEVASVEDFAKGPDALRHPYTKALWEAIPQNGFKPIKGIQPYAGALPDGCLFGPRCLMKTEACEKKIPMRELRGGEVCCIHAT
ncbi:oligopeptide transport ATP-binding protein OppD [Oxobacter pfennigii]|uniref:Nickel import system ATP-binding protein NikD n=1 Tax=Oxobacter pfennigii TaxID=36849 RepID=A0A0P8WDC9_9CLOT|nr:ABC transporter ATP-binding protein [Oxobacter pfennigii]KPU45909.1 oligopeptide transport ATP-binding protein OppD [Oxobacter pfennigii]